MLTNNMIGVLIDYCVACCMKIDQYALYVQTIPEDMSDKVRCFKISSGSGGGHEGEDSKTRMVYLRRICRISFARRFRSNLDNR